MAKTLSAFNTTAVDALTVDWIRLVKIELADLTLYLSTGEWGSGATHCVFNGQLYEPVVKSIATIMTGEIDPTDYDVALSECQVEVLNDIPIGGADRFTALFSSYDIIHATITVSTIFDGASAAGDEIKTFKGTVENINEMFSDRCLLTCSGYDQDLKNKFSHTIVEATTFADADPVDLGKMMPIVYGSVKRVPLVGIDVGGYTTLAEDIAPGATTLTPTDASVLPATGTIIISSDEIAFTGNDGTDLTGCTGVDVAHGQGAVIWEKLTEYVYAAGHPWKAVDDVYIGGVKVAAADFTAYTGQTGDEHGTYTGRMVISFSDIPDALKILFGSRPLDYTADREATNVPLGYATDLDNEGNLLLFGTGTSITFQAAPSGTLSNIYVEYYFETRQFGTPESSIGDKDFVLDGISVATWDESAGELLTNVTSPMRVYKSSWPATATKTASWSSGTNRGGVALTVLSAKVYADTTVDDVSQRGQPVYISASNTPSGGFVSDIAVDTDSAVTFPAAPTGSLSDISIEVTWEFNIVGDPLGFGVSRYMAIDGINVMHIAPDNTQTQLMPYTFTIQKGAWDTSIDKTISRQSTFRRGESFLVSTAIQTAYTDTYVTDDMSVPGGKSFFGAQVTVDGDGYQDDGAGTITGTPAALIERPDHICTHIIVNQCGQTTSEIDSTSYTASGTAYGAASYVEAFALLQPPNPRLLLKRVAYNAKSIQFWEAGTHHLIYIPSTESTDFSIDADRIDLNQIYISFTPGADLLNTFTGTYDRWWDGSEDNVESDRAVVTSTDSDSVTKYGTLQGQNVSLIYIPGETQAQAVLDWVRDDLRLPRLVIEFAGGAYLTQIERGDILDFTDIEVQPGETAPTYLYDALLELVTFDTDQFRVIDMQRLTDGTIQVKAIKIKPLSGNAAVLLESSGWRTLLETDDLVLLEIA